MRGWPLPRPTHAPATTLKTNGNSAPIKPMSSYVVPKLRLGMRPAKLCFAFPLPQLPPEQTQPLPQGGLAFPSESREDSFTPSPAANTCSRNNPQNKRQQHPPQNQPPPRAFQAPMTSWATSMNIAASSPIPMRFMNFISWRSSVRSWAISARSSAMSPRVATCLSNS